MPRPLGLAALALFLTVSACDTGSGTDCVVGTDPGCPAPPPDADEVVAGVNLTALFAAPTAAERDSVAARLARTGGTAAAPVTGAVVTDLGADPDATRYVLLDLRGADGASIAFALARVPALDGGPATPLRTVLLVPDGSGDASEAGFLTGPGAGGLDREAVQVVVAARGASLTARGRTYTSAVPADPYRADVADLLALTDQLGRVPRTNPARLGAVGVGRGGAVVLLAAERRPGRFLAVSSLGAPTTLFDATVRTDARNVLQGRPSSLPAAAALFAPVLALRDGRVGLAEARLRLLELSAVALADRLPATLSFHAEPDDVVPTAHLARLREEGEGTFEAPRRFVPVPEGDHASLLSSNDVRGPLATFLLARL
ncbi:MAG TPA: prolyl oligopeptidase family serine peptidase [Rubricoccaceae bacterium]